MQHIILIGSNYKFHDSLFGFIQRRGTLMRIKLANDVTRYIKFKWLSVHVCKIQGPNASSATDRYVVKYEMMHHFLSHQTGIALWNKILFSWNSRDQWPCENMILEYRFRVCGSWTKFAIFLFTVHTFGHHQDNQDIMLIDICCEYKRLFQILQSFIHIDQWQIEPHNMLR